MPSIGERIGNYQLVEVLASGAFGSVYRAEHTLLKQRQVAIKFLRSERLDNVKERNAFLQEARFLDQLKHPTFLPIVDVGFHDELPYIMTEYAPNGTLRTYIQRQAGQPVTLAEALRIIRPVGEALQYAHEHNIVHRDLKPENILFNAQNEALLADLGIAVLLKAGTTLVSNMSGTAHYMAPEQFACLISPKCDQYALGCILYELLTGKRPFTVAHFSMEEMYYQHANVLPTPPRQLNPALSDYVEAALLKALAKERSKRHTNVASFLAALCIEPQTPPMIVAPPKQEAVQNTATQPLPPLSKQHANLPVTSNPTIVRAPKASVPTPPPSSPIEKLTLINPTKMGWRPATAWYKHPIMIATTIALICLLIAGGIWPLAQRHNHPNPSPSRLTLGQTTPSQLTPDQPTATITITPANRLEQNNYTITAIPDGSIDATHHQIPARIISVTSATRTTTATATGSIPGKVASGTLTFFNINSTEITLDSTILTGKDGVQVSFQGPVSVPAFSLSTGSVTVTGFAVSPGAAGNIPASDISESCCGSNIAVQNASAFTGGLDAIPNSIIRQSDINGAVDPLVTALTQSTQASLQQSIKTNERVVDGTAVCTPAISANQQAGNVAKVVRVGVSVTCHEEVYDMVAAQQMAVNLLLEQAQSDPALNTQYAQVGQIVASVLNNSLVSNDGTVNLEVQVQGLWVYQFSPQMQQDIKLKLVKLPLQSALDVLQHWPGVATPKIELSGGTTLPNNTNDISLTVLTLPNPQGMPGATNGTPGSTNDGPITSPTVLPSMLIPANGLGGSSQPSHEARGFVR